MFHVTIFRTRRGSTTFRKGRPESSPLAKSASAKLYGRITCRVRKIGTSHASVFECRLCGGGSAVVPYRNQFLQHGGSLGSKVWIVIGGEASCAVTRKLSRIRDSQHAIASEAFLESINGSWSGTIRHLDNLVSKGRASNHPLLPSLSGERML